MDRMPLNSCNTIYSTNLSADRLLSLLGGRVRLAILRTLAKGPSHVGGIADSVDASIGLVSHNLRQLRDAGLVNRTIRARERIYTLAAAVSMGAHGALKLKIGTAEGGSIEVSLPLSEIPALEAGNKQTASPSQQSAFQPRTETRFQQPLATRIPA